jgi:tetratricopeptide (TPR) repeat protein
VALARACLAAEPSERPPDAGAVAAAVTAYQAAVRERLRQAEQERTAAQVRLEEARATARAEAARADEARARAAAERRVRRLLVVLAAAGLLLVVGVGGAAWWSQQQRMALEGQRAVARDAAEGTLRQLPKLYQQSRWGEARELLDRAAKGLEESPPDDLPVQVRNARADIEFAARLDAIRQERALLVLGKLNRDTPARYKKAFVAQGLDFEHADVGTLVGLVTASALEEHRQHLVGILDDWAEIEPEDAIRQRLLEVARKADPDEVREALHGGDAQALTRLADSLDVAKHKPATLLALGYALNRAKGDGVRLWRRAQQQHPHDFWLSVTLGNTLIKDSVSLTEAAGYFRAALAVGPESAVAWNNLAYTLAKQARPFLGTPWNSLRYKMTHAAVAWDRERTKQVEADAYDAWDRERTKQTEQGPLDQAEHAVRKALAIDSRYAAAWNSLGLVLQEQKKLPEAVLAYEKALDLDKQYAAAWYNLGNTFADQAKRDEAVRAYNKALECDRNDAAAWSNLGLVWYVQGKLDEAIFAYRQALKIDPNLASSWNNLGAALEGLGKFEEAADALRMAVALLQPTPNPDFRLAGAWCNLGDTLENHAKVLGNTPAGKQKLDEAEQAYKKAVDTSPSYLRAWTKLGKVLLDQKRLEEAEAVAQQAAKANPDSAITWYNLGTVRSDLCKWKEGLEALEKAVKINNDFAMGWNNIGATRNRMGDLKGALEAFQQATKKDPLLATAWSNLGRVHARLRNLDDSVLAFKKAVALDPRHALDWMKFIAGMTAAEQRYQDAVRMCSEVFAAQPALADDLKRSPRYFAAQAAALAACGKGKDDPAPDDNTRARWRKQALDWLAADLKLWSNRIAGNDPKEFDLAGSRLEGWLRDPALASLRDPAALAELPAPERDAWQRLWAEVRRQIELARDKQDSLTPR